MLYWERILLRSIWSPRVARIYLGRFGNRHQIDTNSEIFGSEGLIHMPRPSPWGLGKGQNSGHEVARIRVRDGQNSGRECGKIRGVTTQILREGWDADFGVAGLING